MAVHVLLHRTFRPEILSIAYKRHPPTDPRLHLPWTEATPAVLSLSLRHVGDHLLQAGLKYSMGVAIGPHFCQVSTLVPSPGHAGVSDVQCYLGQHGGHSFPDAFPVLQRSGATIVAPDPQRYPNFRVGFWPAALWIGGAARPLAVSSITVPTDYSFPDLDSVWALPMYEPMLAAMEAVNVTDSTLNDTGIDPMNDSLWDADEDLQEDEDANEDVEARILVTMEDVEGMLLEVICAAGHYGRHGERCQACPAGAVCAGDDAEPMSLPGYWRVSRQNFTECKPAAACAGGDDGSNPAFEQCSPPYTGKYCSPPPCRGGYYIRDGECLECPDFAWLLIVGAVVGVVVVIAVVVWADKKRVNMTSVSIGVDFLQALAVFRVIDFQWPTFTAAMLTVGDLASIDLELIAPECSISFEYWQKWAFVQVLPLAAAALVGIVGGVYGVLHIAGGCRGGCVRVRHCMRVIQTCCCKRSHRRSIAARLAGSVGGGASKRVRQAASRPNAKKVTLVHRLWGLLLTFLYFIYLLVIRNGLVMLDCVKLTSGYQTRLVLDTVPSIECGSDLHLTLLPWAITSLVVYGAGIPCAFAFILVLRRSSIAKDQLLREKGRGNTAYSNPWYSTRVQFGKLYGDFQPQFHYWRVVLLLRKLCLVSVAVMFTTAPAFQVATICLILTSAFTLNSKVQPFLNRQAVSERLLEEARGLAPRSARGTQEGAWRNGGTPRRWVKRRQVEDVAQRALRSRVARFSYDFNQLESTYIALTVLILLLGLVFQVSCLVACISIHGC